MPAGAGGVVKEETIRGRRRRCGASRVCTSWAWEAGGVGGRGVRGTRGLPPPLVRATAPPLAPRVHPSLVLPTSLGPRRPALLDLEGDRPGPGLPLALPLLGRARRPVARARGHDCGAAGAQGEHSWWGQASHWCVLSRWPVCRVLPGRPSPPPPPRAFTPRVEAQGELGPQPRIPPARRSLLSVSQCRCCIHAAAGQDGGRVQPQRGQRGPGGGPGAEGLWHWGGAFYDALARLASSSSASRPPPARCRCGCWAPAPSSATARPPRRWAGPGPGQAGLLAAPACARRPPRPAPPPIPASPRLAPLCARGPIDDRPNRTQCWDPRRRPALSRRRTASRAACRSTRRAARSARTTSRWARMWGGRAGFMGCGACTPLADACRHGPTQRRHVPQSAATIGHSGAPCAPLFPAERVQATRAHSGPACAPTESYNNVPLALHPPPPTSSHQSEYNRLKPTARTEFQTTNIKTAFRAGMQRGAGAGCLLWGQRRAPRRRACQRASARGS